MQSAIVAKLKLELAEPISTQRQVVYILVEIRQLLELTGSQVKYDALWFHASWAVHPRMNKGIAAKLLQYFDEAYPLLKDQELYEAKACFPRPSYKIADGERISERGGNWFTRSFGGGYPDLDSVIGQLEKHRAHDAAR